MWAPFNMDDLGMFLKCNLSLALTLQHCLATAKRLNQGTSGRKTGRAYDKDQSGWPLAGACRLPRNDSVVLTESKRWGQI
jgi:hypothetical protein